MDSHPRIVGSNSRKSSIEECIGIYLFGSHPVVLNILTSSIIYSQTLLVYQMRYIERRHPIPPVMCRIDTQRPRVFVTYLQVGCNKYGDCFRALLEALLYLAKAEIKVLGHGWGLNSSGTPESMPLVCNWAVRYTDADEPVSSTNQQTSRIQATNFT